MVVKPGDFTLEVRPIGSNSHDAVSTQSGSIAANLCHDMAVEVGVPCGVYHGEDLLMWSIGNPTPPPFGVCVIN